MRAWCHAAVLCKNSAKSSTDHLHTTMSTIHLTEQISDPTGSANPMKVEANQAKIVGSFVNATVGTQTGELQLFVSDATGTDKEGFRLVSDGTSAKISFFGAASVVRQTGGAATAGATYTSAEQAMLQKVYDALRSYGLLT